MKYVGALIIVILIALGASYLLTLSQSSKNSPSTQAKNTALSKAQTDCSGEFTIEATEGPYYKEGSPEKTILYEDGIEGDKLVLTGYVLDSECKPLSNVWIDFWQADSKGDYDNEGYMLRGHQFTDENGKFTLETVVPGEYPGRTPHIHVKVRATESSPILTTQLYIPGVTTNENDTHYDSTLLMQNVEKTANGYTANFTFILDSRNKATES